MTTTVSITRKLRSPAADLYGLLADTAKLGSVPGPQVELLEEGDGEGIGVLRRITLPGGVMLLERVVSLDPVNLRFGYLIEDARPHFQHEHGEIVFSPEGEGTRVRWTSTLAIPAGPFTRVTESAAHVVAVVAFSVALKAFDRHLTRQRKNHS